MATYQRVVRTARGWTVTPTQYRRAAYIALFALFVIVLTGAAVRLTDSGLGCPDWPRCYGKVLPPLSGHALIEFGNRAISGAVGVICVAVAVLALLRRPFRRDLAILAWLLPLGVLGQAVLGGFTVVEHLAPGFVMGHFGLSMLILVAAEGLVGTVQYELKLPADMVWVHVTLATAIWVTVLWAVAAAGRLAPRTVRGFSDEAAPAAELETAGRTG